METRKRILTIMGAGILAVLSVSCASLSPVETGSEAPGRSATGIQTVETGTPPGPGYVRKDERTVMAVDKGGRAKNPGRATIDQAPAGGPDDTVAFRDLPDIDIDERDPTPAMVGHDALIERELKRLLGEFGEEKGKVEPIFLKEVKLYVKAFQTNDQYRRFMTNSLKRSARYMPAVKEVFKKRNIPEDMAFIAFLESGFNPGARSHAGAVGMWQFMPATARRYTLRVTDRMDERLDPVRSTYAAVEYFHDLIAIFGPRSFLLALAAYNCGEGRIISCLKKIDNPIEERTFWHIRGCLARETREYPPKVIASAVIGSNPEVFGFPRFDGNGESAAIRTAFADFKTLEEPPLATKAPAPEPPAPRKAKGSARIASAPVKPKAPPPPKPVVYVVRKNNSLTAVAEIFGVERDEIKKWNKMKDGRVVEGQRLRIFPRVNMETVSYRVRKGDTITEICQTFKVRPANLITSNGLKTGLSIKTGQVLVVYRVTPEKPASHKPQRRIARGGASPFAATVGQV